MICEPETGDIVQVDGTLYVVDTVEYYRGQPSAILVTECDDRKAPNLFIMMDLQWATNTQRWVKR